MVRRLIHAQEQVACRRGIAHDKVRIVGACRTRKRSRRSGAIQDGGRASSDRCTRWSWTYAAHVRSQYGGLIISVVPLLVVILNFRREVLRQHVFEDHGNFVKAIYSFRIVHGGVRASQKKIIRYSGNRWITQVPRADVPFSRRKRVVGGKGGLFV